MRVIYVYVGARSWNKRRLLLDRVVKALQVETMREFRPTWRLVCRKYGLCITKLELVVCTWPRVIKSWIIENYVKVFSLY